MVYEEILPKYSSDQLGGIKSNFLVEKVCFLLFDIVVIDRDFFFTLFADRCNY